MLELAPPGTNIAIGLNVRGLLDSPLVKDFAGPGQNLMNIAAPKIAGFDPLKDVDQLLVFFKPDGDKPVTLVVIRGRFDARQMGAGAEKYHDVPVLDSKKDGVLAVLNGDLAIFGERPVVQDAIDRRGSETRLGAELAARIEAAREKYDFWGVGECPQGIGMPGEGADVFRSIDRFSFGAALQQGLEFTAEVHAKSSSDASKLASLLAMIETGIKAQAKDDGTKFEVHAEDGTFRVSASVPEEVLRAQIAAQRTALASALMPAITGEGVAGQAQAGSSRLPESPAAAASDSRNPLPPPLVAPEIDPPPAPVKSASTVPNKRKPEVIKAPNGDTLVLKLPGAK